MRYHVFVEAFDLEPKMTLPTKFLVAWVSARVSGYWRYFKAVDSRTGETFIEWFDDSTSN